jgi:hypothetical protein
VSDDQQADLIRRLREEGAAQAPAELRPEVMAQVAAEPRRTRPRRRRMWRPVLAVGAVACALGGAAIGLSSLDGSSSSGSASSASSAAAADGEVNPGTTSALRAADQARVYTLPARTAATILGQYAPEPLHDFATAAPSAVARIPSLKVTLPRANGTVIETRLRIAEKRWKALGKAQSASQQPVRVIVRPPATTTGN